jgi:hypothetical protein
VPAQCPSCCCCLHLQARIIAQPRLISLAILLPRSTCSCRAPLLPPSSTATRGMTPFTSLFNSCQQHPQHSNRMHDAQLCPEFLTCSPPPPPPPPPPLPSSTYIRNAAHEEGGSGYRCNVEVDGAVVRMCGVGSVKCDE